MFFTITLIGYKRFATLLPNIWLAETSQAPALMWLADSRKGADF
ncbi:MULTISPECIES: hypothetical protein [Peribacillus]|nr:hypothetical protein [Peribacillus sp. Aquil_B1]